MVSTCALCARAVACQPASQRVRGGVYRPERGRGGRVRTGRRQAAPVSAGRGTMLTPPHDRLQQGLAPSSGARPLRSAPSRAPACCARAYRACQLTSKLAICRLS